MTPVQWPLYVDSIEFSSALPAQVILGQAGREGGNSLKRLFSPSSKPQTSLFDRKSFVCSARACGTILQHTEGYFCYHVTITNVYVA